MSVFLSFHRCAWHTLVSVSTHSVNVFHVSCWFLNPERSPIATRVVLLVVVSTKALLISNKSYLDFALRRLTNTLYGQSL